MEKTFQIYYTSDTHGHVFPVNYASNSPENAGLLNLAAQVEKDGNTLVLDGGNSLQGTPLTQYYLENRDQWPVHPVAAAFNAMGLDYFTLGNHDFNFGYEALRDYLRAMDGVCLCTNVEDWWGRAAHPSLGGAHPGQRPAGRDHRRGHRFREHLGATPEPGSDSGHRCLFMLPEQLAPPSRGTVRCLRVHLPWRL